MNNSIAFIGGGNMAASLISGLLAGPQKPEQILACEPDAEKRTQLEQRYNIKTTGDSSDCTRYDTIILAVKPQVLQSVCKQFSSLNSAAHHLFISIAAGVKSDDIDRWLGGDQAVVRAMPNTPALVSCGATALFANKTVSEDQKMVAENILQAVGISIWVNDEQELDAVTAVSGSGPAYFFLLMEAMQEAGESLGLSPETTRQLTIRTALGAATMADQSNEAPSVLRERVTSKGGTTEQAILSFESSGFRQQVKNALQAAYDRSQTLANELGKDN